MATGLRRCYSAGWIPRFFDPLVFVVGTVLGSAFVIVGAVAIAVGVTDVGVYAMFVGALPLLAGLGAWRSRRIGIWTSDEEVVIRSFVRATRLSRDQVVDVRCEARGAHLLGRSDCPVVYTDSESFVVRDLADASPLRWGGSTAAKICEAVRTDLLS